jgi:hypothetical protein
VLYFEVYDNKTAANAVEFLNHCKIDSNLASSHQYFDRLSP